MTRQNINIAQRCWSNIIRLKYILTPFLFISINVNIFVNSKLITLPLSKQENVTNPQDRPKTYQRRRLSSSLPAHEQVATLYQGYGTHYVDLWVGTPIPQRQTVIVDTGSQLIAFPCSGCNDCGNSYHTDQYYDYDDSNSFERLTCNQCNLGKCVAQKCHLGLSYQEGSSWSAFEARDMAYCGGLHDEPLEMVTPTYTHGDDIHQASSFAFEITFGCQTSLTGLFKTQLADGILGMSNEGGAFWKQMHNARVIEHQVFSLCFSRQAIVEPRGTLAGAITFGGRDERLATAGRPMIYAKNLRKNGFFTVFLRRVMLWKEEGRGIRSYNDLKKEQIIDLKFEEAQMNAGGVIVDSGTTDTYFNHQMRDAFHKAWKELTGVEYSNDEVQLSDEELMALPTILFQLERAEESSGVFGDADDIPGCVGGFDPDHPFDVLVAMPPSHYMEFDSDTNKYIPRFYLDEYGGSVLGANFMMGHDVSFDIDNERIGFVESDCDYLGLLNPTNDKVEKNMEETLSSLAENADSNNNSPFTKETDEGEYEEDPFCDDRCRAWIGFTLFMTMSLLTLVNRIIRWSRRYASVEEFVPNIELSSQNGDDDIDERFSIDEDDDVGNMLERRVI